MYLNYYRLSARPFEVNTDPEFMWAGEKHKEALATLKYGVLEGKGLLLLTGDVGVGKTTVVNSLISSMDPDDAAAVISDPGMEKLDFFNHIAEAFGLRDDFETKRPFLKEFTDFLTRCYYQGRRVLLVIDECQLISDELLNEIRLFSNLEKKGKKLITIFLVGQPELNDLLLRPENRAMRQRITVNYNIEPLGLKETRQYIKHRLSVAGAAGEIFDKSAIKEIHRFSGGYPRLINVISDRALLTGFVFSKKRISKNIIRECAKELDISGAARGSF